MLRKRISILFAGHLLLWSLRAGLSVLSALSLLLARQALAPRARPADSVSTGLLALREATRRAVSELRTGTLPSRSALARCDAALVPS